MKGIKQNLEGRIFGRWTVLNKTTTVKNRTYWVCRCACGVEQAVMAQNLTRGLSKSCGCLNSDITRKDLNGQRFTKWTVLNKAPDKGIHTYWTCRCDCGKVVDVRTTSLLEGVSRQCWVCSQKEKTQQVCLNGHDTSLWGRAKSGSCKACLRDSHLRNTYGITLLDFIALYEAQGRKCCICGQQFSSYITRKGNRIEVDHDHKINGKRESVRGLLCGGRFAGCNRKLGKIDNQEWLTQASRYIAERPAQRILQERGVN